MSREKVKKISEVILSAVCILVAILIVHYCAKVHEKNVRIQELQHLYNSAEKGFKNVLRGQYGDVTVTNEDWGSHSSFGTGDFFGMYLNQVEVIGINTDEIVLVQYYANDNGADCYVIAEAGEGDSWSNGWKVHREGSEVIFDSNDSSNVSGYNSYCIYDTKTNMLFIPKPDELK